LIDQEDFKATSLVEVAPHVILIRNKDAAYIVRMKNKLQHKTDDALLSRLIELVQQSRRVEAELVAHIGEVEHRRLYVRYASSMFRSNFTPEP
jgi:hypothetical protein